MLMLIVEILHCFFLLIGVLTFIFLLMLFSLVLMSRNHAKNKDEMWIKDDDDN